jgi:carbon starvation protein
LIQDFFGEVYKPLKKTDWIPGAVFASALACFMWGYLLYSGDIGSIWALFGVSNQLMASVGLIIGATIVLKIADKRRYILTCLIPLAYLYVTVNYAGYWMVRYVYLNPDAAGYSVLNGVLSIIMLLLGFIIIVAAVKKWAQMWRDPSLRMEASIPG